MKKAENIQLQQDPNAVPYPPRKAYLIHERELQKFKLEYLSLTTYSTRKCEFYVKGWISRTREDGQTLEVIVCDEKPAIIFSEHAEILLQSRTQQIDELEPDSRKDTLWGDLKLLTKKALRETKHRIDHQNEIRAKSKIAPVNLVIRMKSCELAQRCKQGEAYYFRIVPKSRYFTPQFAFYTLEALSDDIRSESPALSGSFANFLKSRFHSSMKKVAILLFIIGSTFAYIQRSTTVPDSAFDASAQDKKLIELEEKYKKTLLSKFKKNVESRNDIGILIESAITGNGDALTVWVRKDWKRVSYDSRLLGIKKLCELWANITENQSSEGTTVQLFLEGNLYNAREIAAAGNAFVPVGQCELGGRSWVEE